MLSQQQRPSNPPSPKRKPLSNIDKHGNTTTTKHSAPAPLATPTPTNTVDSSPTEQVPQDTEPNTQTPSSSDPQPTEPVRNHSRSSSSNSSVMTSTAATKKSKSKRTDNTEDGEWDFMAAYPDDMDLKHFGGNLEKWVGLFKRAVVTDFMDTKASIHSRHMLLNNDTQKRHDAELRKLNQELESTHFELVECGIEKKKREDDLEAAFTWVERRQTRTMMCAFFQRWRNMLHSNKNEQYATKLAKKHYKITALRKALVGWRSVTGIHWKKSIEKVVREEAENSLKSLSDQYEGEIAKLHDRIKELESSLLDSNSRLRKYEHDFKQAFLRGVSALSFEANQLFKDEETPKTAPSVVRERRVEQQQVSLPPPQAMETPRQTIVTSTSTPAIPHDVPQKPLRHHVPQEPGLHYAPEQYHHYHQSSRQTGMHGTPAMPHYVSVKSHYAPTGGIPPHHPSTFQPSHSRMIPTNAMPKPDGAHPSRYPTHASYSRK